MAVLTVSQINRCVALKISSDAAFRHLLIKGEISNFVAHRSGHLYFSLKDDKSVVKAVMFRSMAARLKFRPENGMRVILSAGLTVYEPSGVYQLNVTDMQPEGVGDQQQLLEQRKEKLRKAGIFDESAKKPLPSMPQTIGVITSATGAALQDVLHILRRRCPVVSVLVFPVQVQGERAAASICRALRTAQNYPCDVLILGRGGGSAEDLDPFNAESVAYAIYDSRIPVISAVGHETDFTIADAAADRRAPTPSAAAELAVPEMQYLAERVNIAVRELNAACRMYLQRESRKLEQLHGRLLSGSPEHRMQIQEEKRRQLTRRLEQSMQLFCQKQLAGYAAVQEKLTQLDPLRVLRRGYAAVYGENGEILTGVKKMHTGDRVLVRMQDGSFTAKVEKKDEL